MCKTNPISLGRRWLAAGIVRNEAKLGETGACGRRQSSCGGAAPGSETCETKPISRLRIADWGQTCGGTPALWAAASDPPRRLCKTNPIWPVGRTPEGEMRKTNPIWPGRRHGPEGIVQNEPNFAVKSCETNPIWPRRIWGGRMGGVKREVSSVKSERSAIPPSDFKLHTSNLKLPAHRPRHRPSAAIALSLAGR
jgi:hypothetical protein